MCLCLRVHHYLFICSGRFLLKMMQAGAESGKTQCRSQTQGCINRRSTLTRLLLLLLLRPARDEVVKVPVSCAAAARHHRAQSLQIQRNQTETGVRHFKFFNISLTLWIPVFHLRPRHVKFHLYSSESIRNAAVRSSWTGRTDRDVISNESG